MIRDSLEWDDKKRRDPQKQREFKENVKFNGIFIHNSNELYLAIQETPDTLSLIDL